MMNRKKLLFLGKSGLSNLTVWLLVILFQPVVFAQSQAIYSLYTPPGFPAQYQSDYISLLQQGTSQKWNTAEIQNRVSKGIILQLADHANFTAKESYRIETNGNSLLTITSSSTEGLIFGMYKHLRSLGYKFYLPGTLYTLIPSLQNPFGPKKKHSGQTISPGTGFFRYGWIWFRIYRSGQKRPGSLAPVESAQWIWICLSIVRSPG